MRLSWILFVARRYVQSTRKERGLSTSFLAVGGIAFGVITLIAVLGVMNGFQMGFIEDILEISSYHLRVRIIGDLDYGPSDILSIPGVKAVLPFREAQIIVKGDYSDFRGLLLKGIPWDGFNRDTGLLKELNILSGKDTKEAILIEQGEIVLGIELAQKLGVGPGETIYLVSINNQKNLRGSPVQIEMKVAAVFRSGFYEYDSALGFMNLKDFNRIEDTETPPTWGIKLRNRFQDSNVISRIKSKLNSSSVEVKSWRDYNKSFFGALRTEKLMMMILVGLIFLVVGVNIYHSQKRTVFERTEEIGLLKSIGASPKGVRLVFILEGAIIGFIGSSIGILFGLLLTSHINEVFSWVETIINVFSQRDLAFFSPSVFYMSNVPVRVIFHEILLIQLFATGSTLLASYFASRRVIRIRPSEVLRYE